MGVAWKSVLERRDPAGRSLPPTGNAKDVYSVTLGVNVPLFRAPPAMWSTGAGADVTKRLATPLFAGILISGFAVLVVFPGPVYLWRSLSLPGGRLFRGFDPTDLSAYEDA